MHDRESVRALIAAGAFIEAAAPTPGSRRYRAASACSLSAAPCRTWPRPRRRPRGSVDLTPIKQRMIDLQNKVDATSAAVRKAKGRP